MKWTLIILLLTGCAGVPLNCYDRTVVSCAQKLRLGEEVRVVTGHVLTNKFYSTAVNHSQCEMLKDGKWLPLDVDYDHVVTYDEDYYNGPFELNGTLYKKWFFPSDYYTLEDFILKYGKRVKTCKQN